MKKSESQTIDSKSTDTNTHNEHSDDDTIQKKKPQRRRKATTTSDAPDSQKDSGLDVILIEMKQMSAKLASFEGSMNTISDTLKNVMMKGDGSLKSSMKELILEMKEDLLKSVKKNIEILESKLFDKETENAAMKVEISKLQGELESQNITNRQLRDMIEASDNQRKEYENKSEQYSRRNNIKIAGLQDNNPKETASQSAELVINVLKQHNIIDLSTNDIDIAHRVPNRKKGRREIIVRLISRSTKESIMKRRKLLKNSGIFINEDLTALNKLVLMCVKKKQPDEVSEAWSVNGKIFYKNMNDNIHEVKYPDYGQWLDLPWP